MSTKILPGRMSSVDKNGDVQILHQETSANVVLVDRTSNKQGNGNNSVIPSDVNNIQQLTDKLGGLAFKSKVKSEDLEDGLIATDISTATDNQIPNVKIVKEVITEVDEKLTEVEDTLLDANYIVVDDTEEGIIPPESEINDDVMSTSLTWSSDKINTKINAISERIEEVNDIANSILYVALLKTEDGSYTAQKTVAEMEAAYNDGKAIWVISDNVLLPLRKRQDMNTWIFSGYTETQAYDITITPDAVIFTYNDLVTTNSTLPNPNVLRLTGAVNATYDGTEEVVVEIPDTHPTTDVTPGTYNNVTVNDEGHVTSGINISYIDDNSTTDTEKGWSAKKINDTVSELDTVYLAKYNETTIEEIISAYNSGKTIVLCVQIENTRYYTSELQLLHISGTITFKFTFFNLSHQLASVFINDSNTWSEIITETFASADHTHHMDESSFVILDKIILVENSNKIDIELPSDFTNFKIQGTIIPQLVEGESVSTGYHNYALHY